MKNFMKDMNPPESLETSVFERIYLYAERRRRYGIAGSILSFIAFLPFLTYAMKEFGSSGFYNYISLAFTDSSVIFGNLGTFSMSLIDSTPFFAITATLLSVFAFLISMEYVASGKKPFILKVN